MALCIQLLCVQEFRLVDIYIIQCVVFMCKLSQVSTLYLSGYAGLSDAVQMPQRLSSASPNDAQLRFQLKFISNFCCLQINVNEIGFV